METDSKLALESEIELLRRIGHGDRLSFEAFYDRFVGLLFNIAFRVLKNHEAAEDVVQEVFVQIWEKAPLYDPSRGKPSTWAVVLTRNRAIDRVRSERRGDRLREKVESEAAVAEQFDDRSSFNVVTALESGLQMRQAIQKLSKEQREVIDLAFFQSLTHVEIAERLGIPLGTVKARMRRGMIKLRDLVGSRG